MKKIILAFVLAIFVSLVFTYEPFYVDDPTISPCGEKVSFVYMNNLWEVAFDGGVARRLTATNDRITRPVYSPCGEWILFNSDRDGVYKIYRIPSSGGPAELISNESISFVDWFYDGNSFLGTMSNPGEPDIYVKYEFGKTRPLEISGIAGSFGSVSKDGQKIVFDRRGYPFRPAYKGSHNGDLWLYDINTEQFFQLTDTPVTERYPKFSKIHENRIYFASSDEKVFQLYYMELPDFTSFSDGVGDDHRADFKGSMSNRTQLTFFTEWSARDISVSKNTDRIVFEYFKEIWSWNPVDGEVSKIHIDILEDNFQNPLVHETVKSTLSKIAVSPNQELLVFAYKYDLFAVPLQGGEVRQLTFEHKGIDDIVIMDDNETIYFVSFERGIPKLFKTSIRAHNSSFISPRIDTKNENIEKISWSDDKYIQSIGLNDVNELVIRYDKKIERDLCAVLDVDNNFREILPEETQASYPIISIDKKRMLYTVLDIARDRYILRLKNLETNTHTDIFYNTNHIGNLLLCESGRQLFYSLQSNIYTVNLVKEINEKEDNWAKISPPSSPQRQDISKASSSLILDWDVSLENFNLRNKVLVSDPGWLQPIYTTPDSVLYYIQYQGSQTTLKRVKFDGTKNEEVYNFRGSISELELTKDKKTIFYIMNDNPYKLNISSKQSTPITFEYRYSYDTEKLNREVFNHVWGKFGHNFYDPEMHGQDWESIYHLFEPFIHEFKSTTVLQRFVDEMLGRINTSHTGFHPREDTSHDDFVYAYAGIVLNYKERLPVGIKIKKIYFGSELYQNFGVKIDDIIMEINGNPIHFDTEISSLFLNQIDHDIKFVIQTPKGIINASIKGISMATQRQLRYEDTVIKRSQKVREVSNARLGYLHIQEMNQRSLRRFEQDFLAVNIDTDAMIIDVRGNGGGRIHNNLFDIITRQQNAFSHNRLWGVDPYPSPANIYQKPIVVLIDEDSFSNAEIFSGLFQDMKLGTVIGMPTSGSVIGTYEWTLYDGSSMRMPASGWYRMNMTNMELNGVIPDITIPMLPSHVVNMEDPQLLKAIEVLLESIEN